MAEWSGIFFLSFGAFNFPFSFHESVILFCAGRRMQRLCSIGCPSGLCFVLVRVRKHGEVLRRMMCSNGFHFECKSHVPRFHSLVNPSVYLLNSGCMLKQNQNVSLIFLNHEAQTHWLQIFALRAWSKLSWLPMTVMILERTPAFTYFACTTRLAWLRSQSFWELKA